MVAETAKNLGQGAAKAVGSGVRSNSPMAQMIHAARIEAEKQAALEQAAGGEAAGGLGSATSGISGGAAAVPTSAAARADPKASPLGTHPADVPAMTTADQREVPPPDAYREDIQAMSSGTSSTAPSNEPASGFGAGAGTAAAQAPASQTSAQAPAREAGESHTDSAATPGIPAASGIKAAAAMPQAASGFAQDADAPGGLNKENRAKLAEMIRDAQKHVAKNSQ